MNRAFLSLALVALCAPAFAAELKVGDDVVDFWPNNWVNPPTIAKFEQWRGDVILFKAWNKDSEPCLNHLPAMNELAAKPGVHVVTLYTGVHKFAELEALVEKHKISYPIALDSFWPAGYAASPVPKFWVVSGDGKIKFIGESGFEKTLEEELAKVKYPGLNKTSIHASLEPAAQLFGQHKFAEAHAAAKKLAESKDSSEKADAQYICDRIEGLIFDLETLGQAAEEERDWVLAMRCWTELDQFKGLKGGNEAAAKLKKVQDSAPAKKDIESLRKLIALGYDRALEFKKIDAKDPKQLRKYREGSQAAYTKFANDNKGTAGEKRALESAKSLADLLKKPD